MKILLTLFTAFFLFGFAPSTFALSQTQCDAGVDRKIAEFIEEEKGWISRLADIVHAEDSSHIRVEEAVKDLRKLRCDLESICKAIDYAYEPKNAEKIYKEQGVEIDFSCDIATDVMTKYSKKDFYGEEAICPFPAQQTFAHESVYQNVKTMCEEKISLNFLGAQTFASTTMSQASAQDEANYYSAKILSLTDRLKSMGDDLQRLNVYIRRVYESIFCSCRKS